MTAESCSCRCVRSALDLLDALERRGELAARGRALALAVALEVLEPLGELAARGLRSVFMLGAHAFELGREVGRGAGDVLDVGHPGLETGARCLGAVGGFRDRLDRACLGGGDGLGQPAVGERRGMLAVAFQLVQARVQARRRGLGGGERAAALGGGLLAVETGALEALQARELLDAVELARDARQRALKVGAQGGGVALGLRGAAIGLAAGLRELRRQAAGHALEVVDSLQRAQQARDDRGGVVEVVDAALDAGVEVRQAVFGVGVGGGARGVAARELGLDPRRRGQRAEDDERAGRAPPVPALRLRLDRAAQRAHDDRVLLAHAQQHQVHGQLEGEILEEEREVEALVELDGDEHGLQRELGAVRVASGELHRARDVRWLARVEEAAPGDRGRRRRAADQRLEEATPEDLLGGAAEQQLGGLGPLGDRPLAVGQDEVAADDLPQQRVQRVDRLSCGGTGQHGVRRARRGVRQGVHPGSPIQGCGGCVSSFIGRCSHSSKSTAAARESSDALPPTLVASEVVKRSS